MEPPSNATDTFTWVFFGMGAAIAGFLTWLGKTQKPQPTATATVSAALMDNRVVDPLVRELGGLRSDIQKLVNVLSTEAEKRQKQEEERAHEEEVRSKLATERRMEELLEKLAQVTAPRSPP